MSEVAVDADSVACLPAMALYIILLAAVIQGVSTSIILTVTLRLFRNVVAQFIGRLCLINQATTKIWG